MSIAKQKKRCFGDGEGKEFYAKYHDEEWGVPVHDDKILFEMLILEGAQAGLSWETILKKREGYRAAFHNFDVKKVAAMKNCELENLRDNENIIRNKLKIYSTRLNAKIFLEIQKEFDSFDKYIWGFVQGQTIYNHFNEFKDLPAKTELSDKISKDLKERGMKFAGSTIIYAYIQAIGMVNDHLTYCFKYNANKNNN